MRVSSSTQWAGGAVPLRAALVIGLGLALAVVAVLLNRPEPAHGTTGPVAAAVSGRILFGRGGHIWALAGGRLETLTTEGGWRQPHASRDGSQITAVGLYVSTSEVFVLDASTGSYRQLTRNRRTPSQASDWAYRPRWSPDGQTIAFVTDRTSFYPMLWRMNPDGSGLRQLTYPSHGLDAIDSFAWSPDGRYIAATRFVSNQSQIHLVDMARPTSPHALTNAEGGALDPAWSPDGQFLAYFGRHGGRSTLYVLNLDEPGRSTAILDTEMARSPEWSPSGDSIGYIALAGGGFEIFSIDVAQVGSDMVVVGRPSQLTVQFGVDPISGLSWTD